MMISKRWQKQHSFIIHGCVALIWGGPLFLFQFDWPTWLVVVIIGLIWVVGIRASIYLNNHFAKKMVRILRFEHDVTVSVIQRVLREKYIRFSRQNSEEMVRFQFREQNLTMTIESYPLNLPVDDHIAEAAATKVELHGLSPRNNEFVAMLSEAIDEMARTRVAEEIAW